MPSYGGAHGPDGSKKSGDQGQGSRDSRGGNTGGAKGQEGSGFGGSQKNRGTKSKASNPAAKAIPGFRNVALHNAGLPQVDKFGNRVGKVDSRGSNRPTGPFQSASYSSLTPNGNLPATGTMAGIEATIDAIMNGAYSRYGEPDLAPKDITPQDVDALGSNMGNTGGNDKGGTNWLDSKRTQQAGNPQAGPSGPAMTMDDYLAELMNNYVRPNSRYYLEQRGLIDPTAPAGIPEEWAPVFAREFDRIKNTLPGDLIGADSKEADVFNQLRNYYSDQFGKNALDAEEGRRRNDFTTQLNNKGFRGQLTDAFGDTSDDAIIESIINPQYQAAQDILTNQQKRGTLTNTGYNFALQSLGDQRNAANTKLQGIGASQRATASGGIEDYLDEIYGKAGGYQLGQQFDPNSFDSEFGNRLNSAKGGLEGNIRGAAPTNLFDTGTVLSNAGTAQGQSSRGGLLDTLANRRSRTQSRGLGTTGAF